MNQDGYVYHAFLSHAVEDKTSIANELYSKLEDAGVKVWYSSNMPYGRSIEESVRAGITSSKYGIVIISKFFIEGMWTMKEYNTMEQLEKDSRIVILPIFFDVTPEEIASIDPVMALRFGIRYSNNIDHVVKELLKEITKPEPPQDSDGDTSKEKKKWVIIGTSIATLLTLATILFMQTTCWNCPEENAITAAIASRMQDLQLRIDQDWTNSTGEHPASSSSIDSIFGSYMRLKSNYRNEFEFTNGSNTIHSRKGVEGALGTNLSLWAPSNEYNFSSPIITLNSQAAYVTYTYKNTQPVTYTITREGKNEDDTYDVHVSYVNNIRCIKVSLSFPTTADRMKRHRMRLIGFLPDEQFVFEQSGNGWILVGIR